MYPYEVVSTSATHSVVAITCPFCGKVSTLFAKNADLRAYAEGALVQQAFPDMPAADRELFVSGVCASCYPKPPEDEDDEEDYDADEEPEEDEVDFDCDDADDCEEDDCEGCEGCDGH